MTMVSSERRQGCTRRRGSAIAGKNGARLAALDSGTRSSSAEGEANGKMLDDTADFRQMGKGTESWCRVAAPTGMAVTWKKTPDKWAPRGSGCRDYDKRALHEEFS
jgi:hypothetical protein